MEFARFASRYRNLLGELPSKSLKSIGLIDEFYSRYQLASDLVLRPSQKTFLFMGIKISPIRPGWSGLIKGGHSGAEPDRLFE